VDLFSVPKHQTGSARNDKSARNRRRSRAGYFDNRAIAREEPALSANRSRVSNCSRAREGIDGENCPVASDLLPNRNREAYAALLAVVIRLSTISWSKGFGKTGP
jgi:hypothetical protein